MGDPIELKIHGYELTIRLDDAEKIEVKEIKSEEKEKERRNKVKRSAHPGYGEGGKYHKKETENPLKDDETLTFALVGNQNCGKTTLFNQLTGASQHVGKFSGRYRRPQGRRDQRVQKYINHRPSGNLFYVSLQQ